MTTRTWTGTDSNSNSWFDGSNWDPSGVPVAGDTAIIQAGTSGIGSLTVDNVQIQFGSALFAEPAQLEADGGTFGAGATITVERNLAFGTLLLGGGAVFNATANVAGGQLNVFADTGLTGSGLITVEDGGSVNIEGSGTVQPTVTFLDDNGTLILNDPATFTAPITGLQTGDRIELGHGFIVESVSYVNNELTLFGPNSAVIATLNVSLQGSPVNFYTNFFGHGASAITTSQQTRVWGGGTGLDWFDTAAWTNGVPLGGDTVNILSGTAVLTGPDAVAHGTMDFETVNLGAAGSFTPVTLQTAGQFFGPAFNLVALGTPQYGPTYIAPQATFVATGFTHFQGNLSALSQGGTLTVDIESNGTIAELALIGDPGTQDSNVFAEAFAGQESTLNFTGTGTLTNNGVVLVDGLALFGSGVIVQGGGSIEIEAGGSVVIDGSVAATQQVVFGDETGELTINDLSAFQGQVFLYGAAGDQINIGGIKATSLSYEFDTLILQGEGGQPLGTLEVQSTIDLDATDFLLRSDGDGGSLISFAPDVPPVLRQSLPVAAVGTTAAQIPLTILLTQAFGAVPSISAYSQYTLGSTLDLMDTYAYWDQAPGEPTNSAWLLNGSTLVANGTTVQATDIGSYSLLVGNSIPNSAWFTVPNAVSGGEIAQYIQYNVWTVNPAVDAPVTAYATPDPAVPGSGERFGELIASDIVASALRYNDVYNGVINYDNCNWIADNVTAGAGAVMPYMNFSTDPADNQEGGFWRIVYRGSDYTDPVDDWFPLTLPGDVVRMGRVDGGGQHTTTVIGTVNPDGTITVYDNADQNSLGQHTIGIHNPTYWTGTEAASITIYRLDPGQQYLITGTSLTEYLQGSVYNDLIRPSGGADTIVGGPGNNEVQGLSAQINGITFSDFDAGDSLDLTDLAPGGVTTDYDSKSGQLHIDSGGSLVATVTLPTGLATPFMVTADGTGGTSVELACFAAGTRIATPTGAIPVQDLRDGDRVLTASGEAVEVVWLGHRRVNCAHHPHRAQVLPVRIAAGAFGRGSPSRDLLLSPDHAVFVDDVLIPVKYLINGGTIAQLTVAEMPEVTYWHVELPRHDVLLAEGLPTESYLDSGTRANFANGGSVVEAYPDFSTRMWEAHGCAPLCVTGPVLDAVRARLRRASHRRHIA